MSESVAGTSSAQHVAVPRAFQRIVNELVANAISLGGQIDYLKAALSCACLHTAPIRMTAYHEEAFGFGEKFDVGNRFIISAQEMLVEADTMCEAIEIVCHDSADEMADITQTD